MRAGWNPPALTVHSSHRGNAQCSSCLSGRRSDQEWSGPHLGVCSPHAGSFASEPGLLECLPRSLHLLFLVISQDTGYTAMNVVLGVTGLQSDESDKT